MRLDKKLAELYPQKTRSLLAKSIVQGRVLVNGKIIEKPNFSTEENDMIETDFEHIEERKDLIPENIPLEILLETDDFLAVNKAKNMSVHPGEEEGQSGTLVNAVMFHCGENLSGIGGERRPGIVHRLDKDTTGVVIVAKNDQFHAHLSKQIEDRSLTKIYRALVSGNPKDGVIEAPIARSLSDRKKMAVQKGGKASTTKFSVLEYFPQYDASLVEIQLITGRTHQIRVHFTSIGHPVIGDPLYGSEKVNKKFEKDFSIHTQVLHAYQYSFTDKNGKIVALTAPLPTPLLDQKNNPLRKA